MLSKKPTNKNVLRTSSGEGGAGRGNIMGNELNLYNDKWFYPRKIFNKTPSEG